ncbi:amidohydrolase [Ascidiimonas aurantiaca]|uniref:amidohydrolase n=1 Tax=Ascidiimonas aurantiaca TaxID=1685432 RepID=UPI0030EEBAAD
MKYIPLLLVLMLTSCSPKKEQVDMMLFNANIYQVDKDFTNSQAFAIKDGKFIAIGTTEDILNAYVSDQMFDAEGKTVLPGFYDAHCHFYQLGLNKQKVDLTGTTSYEEVLERTVAFQKERNTRFILGRGWDQNDWEVKEFPTKKELDALFPDTPVALERVDGHAYLVNQKALDLAGIDKNTRIEGGEIEIKNGELTGILIDNPMAMVDAVIPSPNRETKIRALQDAEKICFSYGLTTVNDAGLSKEIISLIDSLQQADLLQMQVYAMVSNTPENLDYYLNKGVIKTDKLHVRSVKVYGDGALGSRGAALKEPYSDKPGHHGALVTPASEIKELAQRIAASEYQMNTHAIGDSANIVVLRAYKEALKGKEDRRWKIEHAQIIDTIDFDYFENGIIPSVQPTHATSDMYWAEDRLGHERIKGAYAFRTLLGKAKIVALGTDFPVEKVSPFLTFYAAVARKDVEGYPEGGFLPQESLSREEALKGMTIWAAYSNFEEKERGSIEIGKKADFIILDENIMEVPEEEIPNIKTLQTFISGKKVN